MREMADTPLASTDHAEQQSSVELTDQDRVSPAEASGLENVPLVSPSSTSVGEDNGTLETDELLEQDIIPYPLLATKLWLLELLAIYLGVCSTILLVTLLVCFDNKPLVAWKFLLSLNTIISILGAFTRVSVAFVLSSCLGQYKWNGFVAVMIISRCSSCSMRQAVVHGAQPSFCGG